MKILFVIQYMKMGGVEKALLNLTEELLSRGENVDYFILDPVGEFMPFINKKVNHITLSSFKIRVFHIMNTSKNELFKDFNLFDLFIKLIGKLVIKAKMGFLIDTYLYRSFDNNLEYYDAIIAFDGIPNLATNFVKYTKKTNKKISWVHNDIDYFNIPKKNIRSYYKMFNKIAIVSNTCKDSFLKYCPEYYSKTFTVYNCQNIKDIKNKSICTNPYLKSDKIKLVVVSRMQNISKRLDRVINGSSELKKLGYNNFEIYFLGDGPDLRSYNDLVIKLGLEKTCLFKGYVDNPYPYIKNADAMLITSDYEGYPMTINESYILGIPVIATNFAASNEAIINEYNGLIVERNTAAVTKAIKLFLDNPRKLEVYRNNILQMDMTNNSAIKQFYSMLGM